MLGICHQRLNHTKLAKSDFDWVTIYGKDEALKMAAHQGLDQIDEYRTYVHCPNPNCLDFSRGKWIFLKNSNEYGREFPLRDGSKDYVLQHHLHTLYLIDAKGKPHNSGPCPTCGGTGRVMRKKKLPLT